MFLQRPHCLSGLASGSISLHTAHLGQLGEDSDKTPASAAEILLTFCSMMFQGQTSWQERLQGVHRKFWR